MISRCCQCDIEPMLDYYVCVNCGKSTLPRFKPLWHNIDSSYDEETEMQKDRL